MWGNTENLKKLVEICIGNANEKVCERMQKVLNRYSAMPIDQRRVSDRILGIAVKLRVHCFVDKGERLEKLSAILFRRVKDLEVICAVLQVLLEVSGNIYVDWVQECEREREEEGFIGVEMENLSSYTPSSVYSQVEESVKSLTPIRNDPLMFEGAIDTLMCTPYQTPDLRIFYSNDGLMKKLKGNVDEYEYEDDKYFNTPQFTKEVQKNEVGRRYECEIVYEVLQMILGMGGNVFEQVQNGFVVKPVELSHLTQETLFSILNSFVPLNITIGEIQLWLEFSKRSESRVLQTFSIAINEKLQSFIRMVLQKIEELVQNKLKKPLTLLSLKCDLKKHSEEFDLILEFIKKIPNIAPLAYQSSELLSSLYKYSETAFIEHSFVLNSLFSSTFSQFILETCLWMTGGIVSEESIVAKTLSGKFEWESYSIRIAKVNEKIVKCVPEFLGSDCKKILAIGNYQFLLNNIEDNEDRVVNKVLNSGMNWDNCIGSAEQLHFKIIDKFRRLIGNEYVSVKDSIRCSFSEEIEGIYIQMGKKLLHIFNEKYGLMLIIKFLQRIYLLQDPKFLEEFFPVLQNFRQKQPFEHFSSKINKFFSLTEYKNICFCYECPIITKISDIRICFNVPEIFSFILEDSLKKYQKIFHFLLEVKLASGSIKTLNREYDCILARVQFTHFMNCFEFYSGQSIIMNTIYQFNNLEIEEIYVLKKYHRKFVNTLVKKLFIEGEMRVFFDKISKIFECFNSIFYLNFIGNRFDMEEFVLKFNENFKFLLDVIEKNRNHFFDEECKIYLVLIADLMLGFNKFYI